MWRSSLTILLSGALQLIAAAALAQVETRELVPPEIPASDGPQPTHGPLWLYVTLALIILAGGVAWFTLRRKQFAHRINGQSVRRAVDEGLAIYGSLDHRALTPADEARAADLKRKLDEIERQVIENPQLEASSALLSRTRGLRDQLRDLQQGPGRRAA